MKSQEVIKIISREIHFPKDVAILQTSSGEFVDLMPTCKGYRKIEALDRIRKIKEIIDFQK